MKVATKSNGKTAFAAMHGMNDAGTCLHTAASGGYDVVRWPHRVVAMYFLFQSPDTITAFGFGAELHSALRASWRRHHTKAADVERTL